MSRKKVIGIIGAWVVVSALVLMFAPGAGKSAHADDNQENGTFKDITYTSSIASGTMTVTTTENSTNTIESSGRFEADTDEDGNLEIILDSSDFKKVARMANDMNTATKTGFDAVASGYNDEVAYNKKAVEVIGKIGGISAADADAGSGDGFDKTDNTAAIITKIGYGN